MQHLNLLLMLFIASLSSCVTPGNIEEPPLVDFCDLRQDTTVTPLKYYFRCVHPDESIYSIEIPDAYNFGFEGMKYIHSSALRTYIIRLQGDLSECRRNQKDENNN